jgi:hypothetical protein
MTVFKAVKRQVKRWTGARPYLRQLRARPELGFGVLFDAVYYRSRYHGPLPPLLHFVVAGAFEGANPHPWFDCAFYLRKYPEVAASGVNPLFHYLLHGAREGRKPHPLFQPEYYAAQLSPTPGAEPPTQPPFQPLLHFLAGNGAAHGGGAQPHPLHDSSGNPNRLNPVAEGSAFGQGAA